MGFMKDLRNIEFGELFDIVCNIIAAERIEIPTLTTAWELMVPHSSKLKLMKNQKLTHPLTPVIRKQVNTRTEYLACLRMTVDAKMMSHKLEERVAASHLQYWLKSYKEDIYAPSIFKQSRMVKNLMTDWEADAGVKDATALLDLDELLDEIVKVTAEINDNYLTRLNERDAYVVNGQSIRKAAYKDLQVFVVVLEASYNICASEEQREQIVALSLNLSESLKEFHAVLKSRNTKRRNKKELSAAVKELIDTDLKDSKEASGENNLSMLIYDDRKINGNMKLPGPYEAPASYYSQQTPNGSKPTPKANMKGGVNDKKPTTTSNTEDSSSTNNDKDKGEKGKGGDQSLPPINGD